MTDDSDQEKADFSPTLFYISAQDPQNVKETEVRKISEL